MSISTRSLLGLAAFLLIACLSFGQNVFNCSSDDMGYHACRVGPNNGIRMVRQRSDSACVEGQTYGIRRESVWVNNGCRADFEVLQKGDGSYSPQGTWNDRDRDNDRDDESRYPQSDNGTSYHNPYNRGGYVNSGQPIQYLGRYDDGKSTCSSQPGVGPIYCQSGGPFRDAYLIKQNGQNQCVRDQNWGVDPNHGLWIADGCSGQFKIEK